MGVAIAQSIEQFEVIDFDLIFGGEFAHQTKGFRSLLLGCPEAQGFYGMSDEAMVNAVWIHQLRNNICIKNNHWV